MRKIDLVVLAMAISLGAMGILSGFMVALLHGLAGDWGYMVVFLAVMAFGGSVLFVAVRHMMATLKILNSTGSKEPEQRSEHNG